MTPIDTVELTSSPADQVRTTTCYMCACRCGIRVYLRDGKVRYIEGNPNHPVNKGVLCAKGSAGIMNHYSPARLQTPLKRVGKRGEGKFEAISWDEALALATSWLETVRNTDPKKLVFYTGRDQSQSLTAWWAQQFGTINFAAHGGFCSVNMAAAGLYSVGGAFWEFGEPDWDLTRYFLIFGVAEDHDSNPIKMGLAKLKSRPDTKVISVNPVQTGYSAIADEWLPIRPGTDGLFISSLIYELLRADAIDFPYLSRYTNAPWLVIDNSGGDNDGLFARNGEGEPLVYDQESGKIVTASEAAAQGTPAMVGEYMLADGQQVRPSFQLLAQHYLDASFAPDEVAEQTGIPAQTIRRIAAEIVQIAFSESITIEQPWTDYCGRHHQTMVGRPVSMHAMRGISAHSNGFHTCRSLHLLQVLIGSVDVPGGWRYKPPFPKDIPPEPTPGREQDGNTLLTGAPLGNPRSPEDLLVNEDGSPKRLDKAYSWEFPIAAHGLMHMVLHNSWAQDPYPVDVLFMYMANMAWNSSMNTADTIKYLTDCDEQGNYRIPKFIYSDAYYSETVAYADLVLPDTTYLERYDCISLLDRPISHADGPGDAIRHPVVAPDRDVRPFQDVLLDLGVKLALPGLCKDDGSARYPGGYSDYMVNHERKPGIGPLAGWRGQAGDQHGTGEVNPNQLEKYLENECFWSEKLADNCRYYKHVNRDYLAYAQKMGWRGNSRPVILQLYSEHLQKFKLAAMGHGPIQPPEQYRERVKQFFTPLPIWYTPFEHALVDNEAYPLHAITQRPMHMYHSWGSQNIWLRQITNSNKLYMHPEMGKQLGISDNSWVHIENELASVIAPVQFHYGVQKDTVWTWNAVGKRKGAWGLDSKAPEFNKAFLLNHLIRDVLLEEKAGMSYSNSDPVTGQAAWYDLRVRVRPCIGDVHTTSPIYQALQSPLEPADRKVSTFGVATKDQRTTAQPASKIKEWIANRKENSSTTKGIENGFGNRTSHNTTFGNKEKQ